MVKISQSENQNSFSVRKLNKLTRKKVCLCGLIVRMRVVPKRTVVGDTDQRFDYLSGSHHQSHVNCVLRYNIVSGYAVRGSEFK